MTYRVLIHALFNCIADCYEGDALEALASSLGVALPNPGGGRGAAHLESVSLLIDECRRTGRFWELFSRVYPLPVQRLEDLGLSLSTASRIVATLTPDLGLKAGGTFLPLADPRIELWAYCCRGDWPSQQDLDEILDDCILHVAILGDPNTGVNRWDGPEWVRTACARYGDLPVVFCLPKGTRADWEKVLATYGVVVPASAHEYSTTVNEWKNTEGLDGWLVSQVESIRSHLKKRPSEERIFILHISDIHLGASGDPDRDAMGHYSQLWSDLREALGVGTLDYLVVSGDIANAARREEYKAALLLIQELRKQFKGKGGRSIRTILVPGNHDVDYEESRNSYAKVKAPGRRRPSPNEYRDSGGLSRREETAYRKRFDHFKSDLYEPLLLQDYPADYPKQALVRVFPDDCLFFACVNTAWEIDHHYEDRASIHPDAVLTFQQLHPSPNDRQTPLKILVAHHPIDQMADQGELAGLAAQGFVMCLHGHVHEARQGLYRYDGRRSMHFVGAGTFGARPENQRPGVPLQYNLIVFDKRARTVLVETRRREKPFEPWWADARWGPDRNDPVPRYVFKV